MWQCILWSFWKVCQTHVTLNLWLTCTAQDMLLAQPAWSMISRLQPNYKTYCRHDPHEAWSPDSNNITIHAAGTTLTKHDLQTATKLQDVLLARPAQSMVSRQQQHYNTCCWHNPHEAWSQTATKLQDVLLAWPARSMAFLGGFTGFRKPVRYTKLA